MEFEQQDAEIVDISPLGCPRCGTHVYEEDAYCGGCGFDLLQELPHLCANCGKALAAKTAFCTSCGSGITVPSDSAATTELDAVPAPPTVVGATRLADEELEEQEPRSRRRIVITSSLLMLLIGAAVAGWWWYSQPDLSIFDREITATLAVIADMQDKVDDLQDPSDLPAFATDVDQAVEDIDDLGLRTGVIEGEEYQLAAEAVVRAEVAYLEELHRLASLGSADVDRSEFQRVDELRRELDLAMAAALDLRPELNLEPTQLSVSPLTSSLMDLAAYRQEVIKQRARITAINKERAAELAEVEGFLAQFNGVIERYSTARAELSDWIDGVDTHGASFNEAYQVLYQQAELRRQLRDELAALEAPAEFAPDQAALLAVMDQAVDATEAASRGIEEYQYDFGWRYMSYDETPGWRTFESETAEISDAYSAALAAYEARSQEVLERLSEKKPLPALPE